LGFGLGGGATVDTTVTTLAGGAGCEVAGLTATGRVGTTRG
jgi:hypothetical protein